ncbi:MAG: ROK family protein [Blastocatellia bacterium]|nr:ROK family protein [Blastocatellia bacterium]
METNSHREEVLHTDQIVAESPKTLCVDIGGSGIKVMVLDAAGTPVTERARRETPQPAQPQSCVEVICDLAKEQGEYDRVSVGFPGVVDEGITHTAPNLHPDWEGFELAKRLEELLGKPVRVANDADVQGFGVITSHGVELVLTLGTGLGSALFVNGHLVPNLELGHHPFRKGETYEEQVGRAALDAVGKKKWNRRIKIMIELLQKILNYRTLYIGGGNAKKVDREGLPENVKIVSNEAGLTGGIALWRD